MGVGLDKTNIGTSTSNVKANNYALSVYGEIYPYDDITLEGIIGVGHIQFDTTRKEGASTITGNRDADQIFGSLRIKGDLNGHENDIDKQSWSVHPYAKLEISHTNFEKFSENGSAATALTFEEQHLNNIRTSVGADAHYQYRTDDKTFRPFAQIELGKDLSKTSKAALYYTVQGVSHTHNLNLAGGSDVDLKLGLGLAIETNDDLTMSIRYTRAEQITSSSDWGDNYTDTFDFKLDWKFGSAPKNNEVINTDDEIEAEIARQAALESFQQKLADEKSAAAASNAAYQDRLLEEEFAALEAELASEAIEREIAEFEANLAKELADQAAKEMMAEIAQEAVEREIAEFETELALEAFQQKLADEKAAAAASTAAYQAKLAYDARIDKILQDLVVKLEEVIMPDDYKLILVEELIEEATAKLEEEKFIGAISGEIVTVAIHKFCKDNLNLSDSNIELFKKALAGGYLGNVGPQVIHGTEFTTNRWDKYITCVGSINTEL